ncbi:MFS transporter [Burkholderia sp. Cy-637]|uniref:MFS transporter n=1 Tax=Burkholderia sp. Cy-637 TaxID=2608327 RepID=UPI0014240FB2|nr:MFS transporter [Burkholderia sp. Cy-637]NIF87809.1 MFS transporter [Burkholderia sp. Cy-637]
MNSRSTRAAGSRAGLPLFALAVGAFGIGTTEFAPMGLLPVIARGLHVTIPAAGLLVSAYAIGVMAGAPLMSVALARWPRRRALLLLMAIFTLGNLLSALAPGYAILLAARVLTSLCHGAFFGLGAIVAASLVPPRRKAGAVAAMFSGLTAANVLGVPAAAWLGQALGWRPPFAATAAFGLLAMAILFLALPTCEAGRAPDARREFRVLARPEVLLALATTVLGAAATFTLYTYVAPMLATLTRATPGFVTAMLVLIGCGFCVGNAVGGRFADRSLDRFLAVALALLMAIMLVYPWFALTQLGAALALFAWGAAMFAMVAPLQTRVMHAAGDAPGLASSMNIGAFNLGNALGAAIGGAVISGGWGYAAVPRAGALIAAAGLALVLGQLAARRRRRASAGRADSLVP